MNSEIDPKVVERIQKLLRLAKDGGATEGEADNALAMAQRIMEANNLSLAELELSGKSSDEARLKHEQKGRANYRWQRWIMAAVAEANFCVVLANVEQRRMGTGMRDYTTGYQLIGRISNVTASQHMYDYLLQTVARLRRDYEMQPGNGAKEGALFAEGLANRLAERVRQRHNDYLEEQRKEAEKKKREEAARASHPSAAPTGTSLVVVMADYAQAEADANNDIRQGWEAGTTARKRAEREAKEREQEARIQALMAEHSISWDIAWNMVHLNKGLDEAKAYQERWDAERESSSGRSRYRGGRSREDRLHERLYTGSAGDGRRAGDNVSLNPQVAGDKGRRIR